MSYAYVVNLEFDPIFHDKLESGQKSMTFRQGAPEIGYGEVFFVNHVAYEIDRVIVDISLFEFLTTYWEEDGWRQADEAAEWFMNHYFKGAVTDPNDPALKNLVGRAYRFRKLSPEKLRAELVSNVDTLNQTLCKTLHYLDILDYYKPETAGYSESYLEGVQEFLNEVDDDPHLFDFEDKLFPPEEDAA